jgi:hypothetical protein
MNRHSRWSLVTMMTFPIQELMDEQKCYDYLLHVLHPQGLHCPAGVSPKTK